MLFVLISSFLISQALLRDPKVTETTDLSVPPSSKTLSRHHQDADSNSSSSDSGILIHISSDAKKKKDKGSDSKTPKKKPNPNLSSPTSNIPSLTSPSLSKSSNKPESAKKVVSPFNIGKKSSKQPASSKTIKPEVLNATDSTYKTSPSTFLFKDQEQKSVTIKLSDQELKNIKAFSQKFSEFLPILTDMGEVVKKINASQEKSKNDKPSELFNIKVIEVSDNATTN